MVDEARVFEIEKYDQTRTWPAPKDVDLAWHAPDKPPFRLAGFAWFQADRIFRRLPLKPRQSARRKRNRLEGYSRPVRFSPGRWMG